MYEILIVKAIYRAFARGDIPALLAHFHPAIEWHLAEGHVYAPPGGAFHGTEELSERFFARIGPAWDDFVITPVRMHEAGNTVIVEGRYTGVHRCSGRTLDAEFCHLWTLGEDKVTCFRQYMDTAQLRSVAAEPAEIARSRPAA